MYGRHDGFMCQKIIFGTHVSYLKILSKIVGAKTKFQHHKIRTI